MPVPKSFEADLKGEKSGMFGFDTLDLPPTQDVIVAKSRCFGNSLLNNNIYIYICYIYIIILMVSHCFGETRPMQRISLCYSMGNPC